MSNTLFLTPSEQRLWQQLDSDLISSFQVQDDSFQNYHETEKRMGIRMRQMELENQDFVAQIQALADKDLASITEAIETLDVTVLSAHDLKELCYALGPFVLSGIIFQTLKTAQSLSDIESAWAYSTFRHLYFSDHA